MLFSRVACWWVTAATLACCHAAGEHLPTGEVCFSEHMNCTLKNGSSRQDFPPGCHLEDLWASEDLSGAQGRFSVAKLAVTLRRCGLVLFPPGSLLSRAEAVSLGHRAEAWLYRGELLGGQAAASMLAEEPLKHEGRLFALPPVAEEFASVSQRLAQGPLPALLSELYDSADTPVDLHYLEVLSSPPGAVPIPMHVDAQSFAAIELQLLLTDMEGDAGLLELIPGCFADRELGFGAPSHRDALACVEACSDQNACDRPSVQQPPEAGAAAVYLASLLHRGRPNGGLRAATGGPVGRRPADTKIALIAEFGARNLLPIGERAGENYLSGRYQLEHVRTVNQVRVDEWSMSWQQGAAKPCRDVQGG